MEVIFAVAPLTSTVRNATVLEPHISWNHTTLPNIVFLILAGAMVWRFLATGGRAMLAMMGGPRTPPRATTTVPESGATLIDSSQKGSEP